MNWDVCGFLRFDIYEYLLPQCVSTIYILTEPLDYMKAFAANSSQNIRGKETCIRLTHQLATFLQQIRPNANIAVRRGHAFENFLALSTTKTVICSPSTFCLWAGIAIFIQFISIQES